MSPFTSGGWKLRVFDGGGPSQRYSGKKSPILGRKRQDKPDPRCFKQAKNLFDTTPAREADAAPSDAASL
jgi:hypothetical protein